MSRFKFNDVFVVDDDFVVRILITKILKNIGYEGHIHQFENGELALKFINEGTVVPAEGQFNLILLDINMPTLDGWGFLERFGDLPEDKKFGHYITMITSSIDQSDKDIAFSFADVKDFIQKPVSVQLLKDFWSPINFWKIKVKICLRKKQKGDEAFRPLLFYLVNRLR